MAAYIILCTFVGFMFGLAVGNRNAYNKYHQLMLNDLAELEKLKIGEAKIRGMLDALTASLGVGEDTADDWCE